MKIKCDFCKTEYNVQNTGAPVRCAVCGNVWTPAVKRQSPWMLILAAVTALLAAIIFTVTAVVTHNPDARAPLVATVLNVARNADNDFVVNGKIENRTDEIYGVPNLIIILSDDNGNNVARARFNPPATLLDPGDFAEFSHIIPATDGARKITVELLTNN